MSELTERALDLRNYLEEYVENEYSCCGGGYWDRIENYADEIVRLSEEQDEILQERGIDIDNLEDQKDTNPDTSSSTPKLWVNYINSPVPPQ